MFNIESVESMSGSSRVSVQTRPKASSVTRPFFVGVLSVDVERVGDLDLLLDLFLDLLPEPFLLLKVFLRTGVRFRGDLRGGINLSSVRGVGAGWPLDDESSVCP